MDEPTSYYRNGKPIHERSYCAFLDILGFSDSIATATAASSHDALLERFHRIFREQLASFRKRSRTGLLYFKTFSDNILIGCPAYSSDMESEFGVMVEALGRYQLAMARSGFFIRGGLSLGPLFIDDDQVFGQALLDAHALESKAAVNPIVVLSKEVEQNVNEHLTFYGDPQDAPQARVVLRGPDGRYFVNYLSECVIDTGDDLAIDAMALDEHRTQVEDALQRFRSTPSVFAKYAYLAAYHNHFCDTVSHFKGFSNALRVATAMAEVRFDAIVDGLCPPSSRRPMPPITVFRAARPDNDALKAAISRAHTTAGDLGVGLTYFVPNIGALRSTDLSDVLPEKTLRELANGTLKLPDGTLVRRVSTLTPRHEDGVVLALWTQPALAMDLEQCTMAKAIFVVTNTEDELDAWIEKTGAVVA